MKLHLTLAILFLSAVIGGFAIAIQDDETATVTKREDIKELMELMNSKDMGLQVMHTMFDSVKALGTAIPENLFEEFTSEVNFDELTELIIPIYDKHFSHDDIKELIAFYQTPIGKKLIEKQPDIIKESMVAGMTWGQKIGAKLVKKLREEE